MDAHTGEVYALCSHPSFDPNVFSSGIPADLWEELLSDPTNPLTNKAVAGQYPPGSTFKPVTALAGLEAGVIDASTRIYCPGYYEMGNTKFHCWKHSGHGTIDVVGAIRESCDTFFYETGKRLGIDPLAKMARRLGLGDKLDFDVPGEGAGMIPDRTWKLKRYKQKWEQGETVVAAIGQGYVLTTPLQLATMCARIANGGKAVKPLLVRSIEEEGSKIPDWPLLNLKQPFLDLVHKGMEQVVNDGRGTAHGSQIKEAPYSMGGKTGSAQVRHITQAQRAAGHTDAAELPWKYRDHALFIGYGPIDNPMYATAVIVEHGLHGASAAAPLARDLMLAVQKRDPRRIRTVDDAEAQKAAEQPPAAKPEEKKPAHHPDKKKTEKKT
jgi:penicillin-binding protein 2